MGPSPRMRGRGEVDCADCCGVGSIPAHAGQSGDRAQDRSPAAVHPRACGAEKIALVTPGIPGSIPAMRGRDPDGITLNVKDRSIPACGAERYETLLRLASVIHRACRAESPGLFLRLVFAVHPAHAGQSGCAQRGV